MFSRLRASVCLWLGIFSLVFIGCGEFNSKIKGDIGNSNRVAGGPNTNSSDNSENSPDLESLPELIATEPVEQNQSTSICTNVANGEVIAQATGQTYTLNLPCKVSGSVAQTFEYYVSTTCMNQQESSWLEKSVLLSEVDNSCVNVGANCGTTPSGQTTVLNVGTLSKVTRCTRGVFTAGRVMPNSIQNSYSTTYEKLQKMVCNNGSMQKVGSAYAGSVVSSTNLRCASSSDCVPQEVETERDPLQSSYRVFVSYFGKNNQVVTFQVMEYTGPGAEEPNYRSVEAVCINGMWRASIIIEDSPNGGEDGE